MSMENFDLPTTKSRAHLPQWMMGYQWCSYPDSPTCSIAGDNWDLIMGGGGKPVCCFCLRELRRRMEQMQGWIEAALGEDT